MPSRLTLMMVLAGGLYLGPFLAGLSRQPGWTVAAFAAALADWGVLYRSGSWPRRLGDLAKPEVLVTTLALVAMMLALASLCFLAGRGLSVVTGGPPLPIAVPLAIPALSLGAALLVQSPRKAADMDAFLEDALRQLKGLPGASPDPQLSMTARAIAAGLEQLPESAGEAEVRDVMGWSGVHDAALLGAIDRMGVPPPRPARLAAVLIVTDPEGAPALAHRGEAGWVFDAVKGDPELEALFAGRALALMDVAPYLWRDMPLACDVDQASASASSPETARLLARLRDRLNELGESDVGREETDGSEPRTTGHAEGP